MTDSREQQSIGELVYPESDGQPMGETEQHVFLLSNVVLLLRTWFRDRPGVHVGGNQLLYYVEGNPRRRLCPDVYVAFGVAAGARRSWKTWEEGGFPQVIIELLSDETWKRDVGPKRDIYEAHGVQEYFCFEPLNLRRTPRLRGWRRTAGRFEAVPLEPAVGTQRLRSEKLGLFMEVEGEWLRFVDAETGRPVPFPEEVPDILEAEAKAREGEAEARKLAEAEVARLASELDRLRAELERERRR